MTAYERDTKLDAPDATVRSILLKPPGAWNDHERRIMANRMSAEESVNMGADNPSSVRYGLPTQTGTSTTPTTPATPTQPSAPATTEPKPSRGGNPAFESTMNDFGNYMRGVNDGSVKPTLPGPLPATPRVEQTPGSAYVPNNPAIALAPHEAAGGASATVSKPGTPGQFSVNSLPRGFTSYQNRDGGWTIIGIDGKPQQFASEADAAMWLNGAGAPAAPGAPTAPGTAPFTPPAGYTEASPAGQARMRDESQNAADLAKYGQAPAPTPAKAGARPDPRATPLEKPATTMYGQPATPWSNYGQKPDQPFRMMAPPAAPSAPVAPSPTPPVAMLSPYRNMGINPGLAGQPTDPAPTLPPPAPVQAPNLRPPVTTPTLRQATDVARRFNPLDPHVQRDMVMTY